MIYNFLLKRRLAVFTCPLLVGNKLRDNHGKCSYHNQRDADDGGDDKNTENTSEENKASSYCKQIFLHSSCGIRATVGTHFFYFHIVDRVLLIMLDTQVHKNPDTKEGLATSTRVSPDNAINAPDAGVFTLIAIFDHISGYTKGLGHFYSVVQVHNSIFSYP